MQSREISTTKYGNSNYFTIFATEDEVEELRRIMDKIYDADIRSHIRAHIPFVPYHRDRSNDDYDDQYKEALTMIYQFGNNETKEHIDSMEILD